MKSLAFAGAALAALSLGGPARAGTVFSQPGNGVACSPSCWTSTAGGPDGGFQAYDNFSLATSGTVNTVTWQGFYDDYINAGANPVAPDTKSWKIDFYGGAAGAPGALLSTATLPAAQVTTTFLGVGSFNQAVNVYSFTATLPVPVTFDPGTAYWFSPLSIQTAFDPFFSWSAAAAQSGGTSYQRNVAPGATTGAGLDAVRPDDRAFALLYVPEPGAAAVLLGALAALGLLRVRPRAIARQT